MAVVNAQQQFVGLCRQLVVVFETESDGRRLVADLDALLPQFDELLRSQGLEHRPLSVIRKTEDLPPPNTEVVAIEIRYPHKPIVDCPILWVAQDARSLLKGRPFGKQRVMHDVAAARGQAIKSLKLWIEWAECPLNSGHAGYLEITTSDRKVKRVGFGQEVDFGNSGKPWALFSQLLAAGKEGNSREALITAIWPSNNVTENTLDQHKGKANKIIEALGLEIAADNRGIWRLAEIASG